MANPLETLATRARYGSRQLPRVAWYVGHGLAMRRISARARERGLQNRPMASSEQPIPDQRRLFQDLGVLLERDIENVERGYYPMPDDNDGSFLDVLRRSRLFFQDLPEVNRRREENDNSEVYTDENKGKRPRYYLQNFHYQSGGWMTEDSAARYDTQVEVLFNGSANIMRRQLLPPIIEHVRAGNQRTMKLLDVACGTGRFLHAVKQALPRLHVTGVDMSEPYVKAAQKHLKKWSWVDFFIANGEQLPFEDNSFDVVSSVYMFHELPPKVRPIVFSEMARVVKPGGVMAIMDSLQRGDVPAYDGLLETFPANFHEPYYMGYLDEKFSKFAEKSGVETVLDMPVFVSKAMVFTKPG
ncbi:MAG: class I SAM-dependent methyltransferase [Pseudomonadota bacterium]